MMQRTILSMLFLILLQGAMHAAADQVIMNDGSVINGRILGTRHDSVEIETKFAGTLVIDINEVVELRTVEPVTVMLNSGELLHDQTIESREDKLLMLGLDDVTTEADIASIGKINPEPWEMGIGYDWSGEASLAMKYERGNTDTDDNDFKFDSVWRSLETRYILRGNFEYDKRAGEESKDKWSIIGKHDRFRAENYYWGWNASLEHYKFSNLDSRFFIGPYLGKQWFEQPAIDLSTELGVVYVATDYLDNDPKRGNNDDFPGISWELRTSSQILGLGSKIYLHHMGIWNVTEQADAKIHTTVGINFDLIKGLLTSAEYVYDWDNKATKGVDKVDQSLNMRVGYHW